MSGEFNNNNNNNNTPSSAASVAGVAPVPSPAVLDTMVKIIMGQTDMTNEEVICALERTNYDLKRVIREYMRGESNDQSETGVSSSSTNQLRFSEIRQFMDTSDQMYYRRQEMAKIHKQVIEIKKAQADGAAAAAAAAAKL
jgi:hypothetical protein